jgi:hypothetical protein
MHYRKHSLNQLLLAYPEGIPLPITSSLLPVRTKLSLHIYLHVHLHANMAGKKENKKQSATKFSRKKLNDLITSLELLIKKLKAPLQRTAWSEYYDEASGRKDYLEHKRKLIRQWLVGLDEVKTAADLGANNGEFSQLLSSRNIKTIAADFDPYCINSLYNAIKKNPDKNIQPIVIDLANPTPAIGFSNKERASFMERLNVDLVLALALIHHLAIGKNIPLEMVAEFFSQLGKWMIIEFIPKMDEKIQLMLSGKKDIYPKYDKANFEKAFSKYYRIKNTETIAGSDRTLYLMEKK